MKNFYPSADEVKDMRSKGGSLQEAKNVLTNRNIMAELQDISEQLTNYGHHPDFAQQQLARTVEVMIFIMSKGSINF